MHLNVIQQIEQKQLQNGPDFV